jgi:comEA protein
MRTPAARVQSFFLTKEGLQMIRMLLLSMLTLSVFLVAQPLAQSVQPKTDAPVAKSALVLNLNTATATDLQELPGIGAKTAARIVDYRQKNGPFKKIEELMNVQGVGEKSFLKLRSQITVGSKSEPANQQH